MVVMGTEPKADLTHLNDPIGQPMPTVTEPDVPLDQDAHPLIIVEFRVVQSGRDDDHERRRGQKSSLRFW
jgi:hypothetical protein